MNYAFMFLNSDTGIKADFTNKQITNLSVVSTQVCSDSVKLLTTLRKVDVPAKVVLG